MLVQTAFSQSDKARFRQIGYKFTKRKHYFIFVLYIPIILLCLTRQHLKAKVRKNFNLIVIALKRLFTLQRTFYCNNHKVTDTDKERNETTLISKSLGSIQKAFPHIDWSAKLKPHNLIHIPKMMLLFGPPPKFNTDICENLHKHFIGNFGSYSNVASFGNTALRLSLAKIELRFIFNNEDASARFGWKLSSGCREMLKEVWGRKKLGIDFRTKKAPRPSAMTNIHHGRFPPAPNGVVPFRVVVNQSRNRNWIDAALYADNLAAMRRQGCIPNRYKFSLGNTTQLTFQSKLRTNLCL